jgi:general secretion pathway protein B
MSLILDALKKLDREKTAKNGGKMDITAEILKAGDAPQKNSILPLVLTLALTAFVAALATYLFFGGPGSKTGDPRSTAPAVPAQAGQVPATPLPPAPAALTDKPPLSTDRSPVAPPVASIEAMRPDNAKKGGDPTRGKAAAAVKTPGKTVAPPKEGVATLPILKISGIVWEEVPSERKAVINGAVAREGDTVEGVKVLEIHPTHVVVSSRGKSFKVKMFD